MTEDSERLKLQADYLLRNYSFYAGHINTIFNFYLITAGLIANAFVQSLSSTIALDARGSMAIAFVGALLSAIFWLIDMRSRTIVSVLEGELAQLEPQIFTDGGGFFRALEGRSLGPIRLGVLFPLVYLIFVLAFLAMLAFAMQVAGYLPPLPF